MFYADTSVVMAALTVEAFSGRAQSWLEQRSRSGVAISPWVAAEFESALGLKQRTGHLDDAARAKASLAFEKVVAESVFVAGIVTGDFAEARRFLRRAELGLRTPDALHLAIASRLGMTLGTLDRRLAAAGEALGVSVDLV